MIETDEKERIDRLVRIVDKMLGRSGFKLKVNHSYDGPVYIISVSDEIKGIKSFYLKWNSLSDCFLGNNNRKYIFWTVFDFLSHIKTVKRTKKEPWYFYETIPKGKTFSSFSELELWLAVQSE